MKILIVEDDFTCRVILQELIKKYGTCHSASNGKEALEAFENMHSQGEPYDLICLDIMMPEVDGQEALQQIREIESQKGIGGSDLVKIIMTTALNDAKNIMQALVKGSCDGYLTKPIIPEDLDKLLNKLGINPLV